MHMKDTKADFDLYPFRCVFRNGMDELDGIFLKICDSQIPMSMRIWLIDISSITPLKKTGREVGRRIQEEFGEGEFFVIYFNIGFHSV